MTALSGARVVVTRHDASELARLLEERGARVLSAPVIAIVDPSDWSELDDALASMRDGRYRWVAFTSVNAVEKVMSRVRDPSSFARVRVAAVGPATAARLRSHGVVPDLVPERFTSRALAGALGSGSGGVLLPRVEGAPRPLVDALEARGWSPHEVSAYRNLPAAPGPGWDEVRAGGFDAVTFTSASTVRGFERALGALGSVGLANDQSAGRLVACIGPETAAAARELGMRVDAVATEHTAEGLVEALARRMSARGDMAR